METIDYNLTQQYISDDSELCEEINELIQANQTILLVAPQGVGKTSFMNKYYNEKTVFIFPTVALAEQNARDTSYSLMRGVTEQTKTITNSSRFNEPLSSCLITTFQSSKSLLEFDMIDNYDYLFIDEIHKGVQYSSFAHSQIDALLEVVEVALSKGKKVIFATATPSLIPCLKDTILYDSIDVMININSYKNFTSKCFVLSQISQMDTLLNYIDTNSKEGGYQIVLYNNTSTIDSIAQKLNARGIKSISVDANNYKTSQETKQIIEDLAKNQTWEYQVLITTSWIDVGLNFISSDIKNVYCLFDSHYNTGDITTIRQFMARTRNSQPNLYINIPYFNEDETRLVNHYTLKTITDMENAYNDLFKLANDIIEKYKIGLIKESVLKYTYGIYQEKNGADTNYLVSSIMLRYHIHRIYEKVYLNGYDLFGYRDKRIIALMLGVLDESIYFDENIDSIIHDNINAWLNELAHTNKAISRQDATQKLYELSYGTINIYKSIQYILNNFPFEKVRNNGKYRFVKV